MKHKIILLFVITLVIAIFVIGLNEYVEGTPNMTPLVGISFIAWFLIFLNITSMTVEEKRSK